MTSTSDHNYSLRVTDGCWLLAVSVLVIQATRVLIRFNSDRTCRSATFTVRHCLIVTPAAHCTVIIDSDCDIDVRQLTMPSIDNARSMNYSYAVINRDTARPVIQQAESMHSTELRCNVLDRSRFDWSRRVVHLCHVSSPAAAAAAAACQCLWDDVTSLHQTDTSTFLGAFYGWTDLTQVIVQHSY